MTCLYLRGFEYHPGKSGIFVEGIIACSKCLSSQPLTEADSVLLSSEVVKAFLGAEKQMLTR